jgi:hypothetical protein
MAIKQDDECRLTNVIRSEISSKHSPLKIIIKVIFVTFGSLFDSKLFVLWQIF